MYIAEINTQNYCDIYKDWERHRPLSISLLYPHPLIMISILESLYDISFYLMEHLQSAKSITLFVSCIIHFKRIVSCKSLYSWVSLKLRFSGLSLVSHTNTSDYHLPRNASIALKTKEEPIKAKDRIWLKLLICRSSSSLVFIWFKCHKLTTSNVFKVSSKKQKHQIAGKILLP